MGNKKRGLKVKHLLKVFWHKKNLPPALCFVLIVLLLLSFEFYFGPLYEEEITLKNALYAKWPGFSAIVLILLVCPKQFRAFPPVALVACVLNATALAVNDGYMPVTSSACIYVEGHHIPMNGDARLPFLCDWIFGAMSIGDMVYCLVYPIIGILFYKEIRQKRYSK